MDECSNLARPPPGGLRSRRWTAGPDHYLPRPRGVTVRFTMVEGPRMALGFCMGNVSFRGNTVRIMHVLRKDRQGRRLPDAMIPRALRADLTSSEVAAAATLHRLLGLRSRGPTAVSASLIRRFVLCFCVGSGVASGDCASGAGSATGLALPSITFAAAARRASRSCSAAIPTSSCSSVIALMALPECSSFISLGIINAQIFMYAAG